MDYSLTPSHHDEQIERRGGCFEEDRMDESTIVLQLLRDARRDVERLVRAVNASRVEIVELEKVIEKLRREKK